MFTHPTFAALTPQAPIRSTRRMITQPTLSSACACPRRPRSGVRKLRRTLAVWAAALGALGADRATAQIFANTNASDAERAVVMLSNFRSEHTPDLLIAQPAVETPGAPASVLVSVAAPSQAPVRRLPTLPRGMGELIRSVAAQVEVAPALLHAVIAAESAYDTRALSARGAIGLMQLMPATARRFGAADAYAPRDNLTAGARYLKWLLALFDGDLELALAAYNAGEQAVMKAGRRVPAYAETQAYVPRVLSYLQCANQASCLALQGRRSAPLTHGGRPAF